MTVRVVIADDQTVVREGLRSMLGLFDSLDVVGVASSAEDALVLVAEQTPDVLLTDLRMPGIGGIEGIRRLVASGAATRAVALTTYDDDATIVGRTACNFQGATDIERMHDDVGQGSSGTPARRRETLVGAGTEE